MHLDAVPAGSHTVRGSTFPAGDDLRELRAAEEQGGAIVDAEAGWQPPFRNEALKVRPSMWLAVEMRTAAAWQEAEAGQRR